MSAVENYQTEYTPQLRALGSNSVGRDTQELLLSLSTPLNLVMVKGILFGNSEERNFKQLLQRIESHFENTNILNVYIKLDAFDLEGIAHLFSLVQILNKASKNGNYISVYWNTKNDNSIQVIASEFHKLLECDFHICDI